MTDREQPKLDSRRAAEFKRELEERTFAWIRDWDGGDKAGGFGRALLDVAARFNAQVAERLDRAGEKLSLGLLDWLAVRGKAAVAARMPVAFKLADNVTDPVLAKHPVQLQANVDGSSVTFETESDVKLVPGKLDELVGVNSAKDIFVLAPPGLPSLDPLDPMPDHWRVRSFAETNTTHLQLDPALGLVPGLRLDIAGSEYRVIEVEGDLVTVDPPLEVTGGVARQSIVSRIDRFAPFDGVARNQQEHFVYLGDKNLFDMEAKAKLVIHGAGTSLSSAKWEYFGKADGDDEAKWRALEPSDESNDKSDELTLIKPKGAVEITKIGKVEPSRWIRARQRNVESVDGILLTEALTVVVNPGDVKTDCQTSGIASSGAEAQAFANTTALSFTSAFYPLGREPRQFDSFFLGCADAFSKEDATVSICFEMSDPAAHSFASWREGLFTGRLLASVGGDGALHLIEMKISDGTLRPLPGRGPLQPKRGSMAVGLDLKPKFRLPAWSVNDGDPGQQTVLTMLESTTLQSIYFSLGVFSGTFGLPTDFPVYVGTTAGNTVWVWKEYPFQKSLGRWIEFDPLPSATNKSHILGLVYLRDNKGGAAAAADVTHSLLLAIIDGRLFVHSALERRAKEPWLEVSVTGPNGTATLRGSNFKLAAIVGIDSKDSEDRWHATIDDGLVAVYSDGVVGYVNHVALTVTPNGVTGVCTELDAVQKVAETTQPAAARVKESAPGAACIYVFWQTDAAKPTLRTLEFDTTFNRTNQGISAPGPTSPSEFEGFSLEIQPFAVDYSGVPTVIATGRRDAASYLVTWMPLDPANPLPIEAAVPSGTGPFGGAPTLVGSYLVVPGTQSDAWVTKWDPVQRRKIEVTLKTGVVAPDSFPALVQHDYVATIDSALRDVEEVVDFGVVRNGERLNLLGDVLGEGAKPDAQLFVYRGAKKFVGHAKPAAGYQLELQNADNAALADQWLLVQVGTNNPKLAKITGVNQAVVPWRLKLSPAPGGAAGAELNYWYPEALTGRLAPAFELDTSPGSNGDWDAALLDRVNLVFGGAADPDPQRGKAFRLVGTHPQLVALGVNWQTAPGGAKPDFLLDASTGEWFRQLGDNSSNPEVSWEYWNGRSWWPLSLIQEGTLNLKRSGRVDFDVPDNISQTDVNGVTNYWLRARLIGGDYGRESVKVVTKPVGTDGTTEQTVIRTPAEISPPLVVNMRIRYSVDTQATPEFLLSQDAFTMRDQSDANRTEGAFVEAFVPLSVQIGRLERGSLSSATSTAPCPVECGCDGSTPTTSSIESSSASTPMSSVPRSILLGFSAELSGEPVNVLLLVDERNHDAFAPLVVEALINDGFEAITVSDKTRALGESGLLSLAFAITPSPRDLFGKALTWVRLRPSKTDGVDNWKPLIRGAYLNAVWASATETLTREALGSSDGRPRLTVNVARPPLLADSLELRVREPLDDEERDRMLADDPDSVKSNEIDLPGHWVKWRQVADPTDCAAGDRVYTLDEKLGEIEFGDGLHGMIPPIGRDSLVAFQYRRTEAPTSDGVPANDVTARTALQLVTPVEGVEGAFAADHAAGGSPPEPDERVLRFGNARLRHRSRALSATDFEDLVLESSPDVAQARAIRKSSGLQLVVVMRGAQPTPSAPQRRELKRLLLNAASPLMRAPQAIDIVGPRVRRLRVALDLRVESLDDAGRLADATRERLEKFFDSVTGGVAQSGWPLGVAPSEEDIAFALNDAPGLAGIGTIDLVAMDPNGNEMPWNALVGVDELVMLADDAFRLKFEALGAAT